MVGQGNSLDWNQLSSDQPRVGESSRVALTTRRLWVRATSLLVNGREELCLGFHPSCLAACGERICLSLELSWRDSLLDHATCVVHKHYRKRGLARGLITALQQNSDDIFGVISSHPAAYLAAATSYGSTFHHDASLVINRMLITLGIQGGIERISIDFIQKYAKAILETSPISYIRDAKLTGSIFGQASAGMVSGVNTDFFVNHDEPLKALMRIREELSWPL